MNSRWAVELNEFLCYFINLYKTPPNRPLPTPLDGRPCVWLGERYIELTPYGGQTEHHGDDVCGGSCDSYCWLSMGREFFIPARTFIGVKLLTMATLSAAACLICDIVFTAITTAVSRSRNSQWIDKPTRLMRLMSWWTNEADKPTWLSRLKSPRPMRLMSQRTNKAD